MMIANNSISSFTNNKINIDICNIGNITTGNSAFLFCDNRKIISKK